MTAPRSLGRLLVLCAVIGAALLLVAALAPGFALADLDRQRADLVDRFDPALVDVQQLTAALLDQETGVRGYVLGGDPAFLAPYQRGRGQEDELVSRLQVLLAGDPTRGDLDAVVASAGRWRAVYAAPAVAATAARTPAPDPGVGREEFDRVRGALDVLTDRLTAERDAARRAVDDAVGTLRVVGLLVLALLAAGLSGLLLWVRHVAIRPTERLAGEVREVAAGDLSRPVTVRGPREITGLARDVDAMRRAILDELAGTEAARRELARSNADLEQFAYVASHDLQEPLRKVASFCQLLGKRYRGQLDERADQYIDFAVDGAKRMQVLINDLLAFSRVGRSDAGAELLDAGAVLDRATENLAGALEETGGAVTRDALPRVRAEPALLTTVFQNLLGNALKFRGEAPPQVHVAAERDGERWLLRFTDNGIGIDPEYDERIFAIFQRLHAKSEYPGTGIGLAMCRKIVEHHGGAMWLEHDQSPGSTFVVALPVPPGTAERPETVESETARV